MITLTFCNMFVRNLCQHQIQNFPNSPLSKIWLNYYFIWLPWILYLLQNQLLELTQFSCHNFTFLCVQLSLKLIVEMSPWRFTKLFSHFTHPMRFNYTQRGELVCVWFGAQADNTLRHQLLPWLGKKYAK